MTENQCIIPQRLAILIMLCWCSADLFSQHMKPEETRLKKGTKIVYKDTSLIIRKDTLIHLPDTNIVKIRKGLLFRLFHNYAVVNRSASPEDFIEPVGYDDHSAWYIGKVIGDIKIMKLDVFGTRITDTAYYNTNKLVQIGNKLHITTRDGVIRKNLLFSEGDEIVPFMLGDGERLLRALPYVKDSRVYTLPRPGSADTVDVLVVEKDIWSINLDLRFPDIDEVDVKIRELNLAGWGHQFKSTFHFELDQPLEYELLYEIPNLFGSFTAAQLSYANTTELKLLHLSLKKDFITSDIKYGGGFDYQRFDGFDEVYDLPWSTELPLGFRSISGWLGRSFKLESEDPDKSNRNIILALGTSNDVYFDRPEVTSNSNLQYQNSSFWSGSFTFLQRNFFKDNYIFGFGKTEDVPDGFRLELTTGYELGEFTDRYYAGLSFSHAHFMEKLGYLSNSYSAGSYLYDGQFDQSVVEVKSLYFTRLLGREKAFRQRSFLDISCLLGFNRRTNEVVSIDNRNGIRGLKSDFLRGHSRLVLNLSHLVFTPWKPLGFQIAFAGFFDFGYVSEQTNELFSNGPYTGFGLAIQANNEDLVFGILELRLSFYPSFPEDANSFRMVAGSSRSLEFNDFSGRPPAALTYGN